MNNLLYILMNYLNNSTKKDTYYYIALSLAKGISYLPNWNLEQTAVYCNVSVSTLNRFFKDIGYKNFSTMKENISHNDDYKNLLLDFDSMRNATDAIYKTLNSVNSIDLNLIRKVCEYIDQCDRVIFFAYGNNINLTLKAQVELMLCDKLSVANIDTFRQLSTIQSANEKDLVICISMNGSSLHEETSPSFKELMDLTKAKSILITQIKDCAPYDYFDLILNIGPDYNYNSSKYGVIYILDLICSAYKSKKLFF